MNQKLTTDENAEDLVRKSKVILESFNDQTNYYEVVGILIRQDRETRKFHCGCMDCVVKRIPNELEPRCCYTKAITLYQERQNGKTKN